MPRNLRPKALQVSVPVKAMVRIISSVERKPLTLTETFHTQISIEEDFLSNLEIAETTCQVNAKIQFAELFRERLRNDSKLKHQIGGVRWSVETLSIECELHQTTH